ncbi:MAG: DNA-processing protein DprA, partial [Candidatus Krumholzibacteria bacterium]|nr:DNA-processing protein DprA [Candidatus Krumholzibacteria bacterium]
MGCSDAARLWLGISLARGARPAAWISLALGISLEEIAGMLGSEAERERLSRILARRIEPPDRRFMEEQLARIEKENWGLVSLSDESYPRLLREIPDPPLVLFHAGELAALAGPSICIVGSRRSSRRGLINASNIARELSGLGIHVVSGLARGIDGAAHEGALAGAGGTSAVLGCGVDVVYPSEHLALVERIVERGCVLSEFPLGTPPLRHHFPRRNRILSGLSLGVAVVEADVGSGAMGTAQWACDQNREVFAVPGPIDYPGSRGPHRLIRDGATLIESAGDIIAAFPCLAGRAAEPGPGAKAAAPESFGENERAMLSALDVEPKHIDELLQFCHIPPAVALSLLLDLEMRGLVASCGSGTYALASPPGKSEKR